MVLDADGDQNEDRKRVPQKALIRYWIIQMPHHRPFNINCIMCSWQSWIAQLLSHPALRLCIPALSMFMYMSLPFLPTLVSACPIVFSRFHLPSLSSSSSVSGMLPSLLTHPFCTLANPKLCPLHLCSISGFITEHWDASYMLIQFCIETEKYFAHDNEHNCTKQNSVQLASAELMSVFLILKVNRAPRLVFWCVCCFRTWQSVCMHLKFGLCLEVGCHLTSRTCLWWPDVNQPVPRLFSLPEYGSAGERSRRAKKRNIGRYTWSIINNSQWR